MLQEHLLLAFGLTVFAGLATGLGGLFAVSFREFNHKFFATALGFSAGVMLYVSFMEILPKSILALTPDHGNVLAHWIAVGSFFGGILLIGLIDHLVPSYANPHEVKDQDTPRTEGQALMRMGLFAAFAIGLHNFPEGLATFLSALQDPALGVSVAVAIALHNIPEGIAVAVPVYYATRQRGKALWLASLSGLAEPVGAALGYVILMQFFSATVFGTIFAMVAGIMVYISLDELLPTAERYGEHHAAIYGVIGGMGLMALSLLLFLS